MCDLIARHSLRHGGDVLPIDRGAPRRPVQAQDPGSIPWIPAARRADQSGHAPPAALKVMPLITGSFGRYEECDQADSMRPVLTRRWPNLVIRFRGRCVEELRT